MERIYMDLENMHKLITERRHMDHIERYLIIRRFMYGDVVDLGCGIGYGSYLISQNHDVENVIGFDISESITFANDQFSDKKIIFTQDHNKLAKADVLVAMEIIEHIFDPKDFLEYVEKVDPNIAIISVPNKPSVAYNPYHFHDYTKQDICNIMVNYISIKCYTIKDVSIIVFIKAPANMPRLTYHNFLDIWV
jgi:2-polyprenyl-3-methyl-5-hydroxy-6-metoxy-1,4-benzoquinol methylase